jgi:hypothetical protein
MCFNCQGTGWIKGTTFKLGRNYSTTRVCPICNPALPLNNSAELFEERMEAERTQTRKELEAEMRKPLRDISNAAGEMERKSPLFYGHGDNPTLF